MNTITVILPTFNRREWLQRAVESVLREKRVPILLHIFDNASTDDTHEYARIVAASDSRVRYTRNPLNIGGTANYIQALHSIDTEYFVPLADDDWLFPDFLFEAYNQLERIPELGAAVFVTSILAEGSEETVGTLPPHRTEATWGELTPETHLREWMRHGHYSWSSVLWRKDTLETIGSPYFHVGLPSDVDFQLQIFCRHPVCLTNRPGSAFFMHANQASRGFSLSDLHSWAALFKRLDRTVRERNLFAGHEYLGLRKVMQNRYRDAWNLPSNFPVEGRRLLSSAVSAGFRLGDWDLAFALLDRFVASQPDEKIRDFVLPEISDVAVPSDIEFLSKVRGLLPSVIAWFKITKGHLDASRGSFEPQIVARQDLESQLNEITCKLSVSQIANDSLSSSLEKWRTRAISAESDRKKLKLKVNVLRSELKNELGKSIHVRVRSWWRRIRGKG